MCNSMGSSPTGASPTGSTPTTIYILMHNFIISYRAGFNLSLSLLKRKKNIFHMIPNFSWYVKYFWCETYYIVIFEKSCNSSTLLMELFTICGHLYFKKSHKSITTWVNAIPKKKHILLVTKMHKICIEKCINSRKIAQGWSTPLKIRVAPGLTLTLKSPRYFYSSWCPGGSMDPP